LPLGNDIVDLEAASQHRPAYYDRMKRSSFHSEELSLVRGYENQLWLLWAAKESAFKAIAQAGRVDKRFNPKDFLLRKIYDLDNCIYYAIDCEDYHFNGFVEQNAAYLHAISWLGEKPDFYFDVICDEHLKSHQEQSNMLRYHAIERFSKELLVPSDSIRISKDENMIPFFDQGGLRLANNLSLSHHGTYLAYAFSL